MTFFRSSKNTYCPYTSGVSVVKSEELFFGPNQIKWVIIMGNYFLIVMNLRSETEYSMFETVCEHASLPVEFVVAAF